jgi:NADH-quinone oxidoreductase subunit L
LSDKSDASDGHHAEPHVHAHPDPHGFFFTEEEAAARAEHEHHHALDASHTPKEVYPSMWIPLVVLAALSVFGGFALNPMFQQWLYPGAIVHEAEGRFPSHATLILLSTVAALAGIGYGIMVYLRGLPKAEKDEKDWHPFRRGAGAQFGWDRLMMGAGVEGGDTVATWLWKRVDMLVIDGFYNALGWFTTQVGYVLRLFQTGFVRSYALVMLIGAVALIGSFWYAVSRFGGQP